jgi:hypothetical protein
MSRFQQSQVPRDGRLGLCRGGETRQPCRRLEVNKSLALALKTNVGPRAIAFLLHRLLDPSDVPLLNEGASTICLSLLPEVYFQGRRKAGTTAWWGVGVSIVQNTGT